MKAIVTIAGVKHIIDIENKEQVKNMKQIQIIEQCKRIIENVSNVTGIPVELILSKKRKREIVIARQVAMYLCRQKYGYKLSLSKIGSVFGKDHSTVVHACKQVKNAIEINDHLVVPIIHKFIYPDTIEYAEMQPIRDARLLQSAKINNRKMKYA